MEVANYYSLLCQELREVGCNPLADKAAKAIEDLLLTRKKLLETNERLERTIHNQRIMYKTKKQKDKFK